VDRLVQGLDAVYQHAGRSFETAEAKDANPESNANSERKLPSIFSIPSR
jgi:hypothetical protein